MSHALIIDQNVMFWHRSFKTPAEFGVDSFDHVWRLDDALTAAKICPPDLVLVSDRRESDNVLAAARLIVKNTMPPDLILISDARPRGTAVTR